MSHEAQSDDMMSQNILLMDQENKDMGNFEQLLPAHCAFQRRMVNKFMDKPEGNNAYFINIGCKEDPANLGDWRGCLNMDVQDYDHATQQNLSEIVKNYKQGDYLAVHFDDECFDGIVLGEVLEHCTIEVAEKFIKKMANELKRDGVIIITVPHDNRPKEEQYDRPEEYLEYAEGITSWHQTVWTEDMLRDLFSKYGLKVVDYDRAWWMKERGIFWHMMTLIK